MAFYGAETSFSECFVQVDGYIVHPFIFFAYFHWYFFFLTVLVLLAYFLYTKGFFFNEILLFIEKIKPKLKTVYNLTFKTI